MFAGFLNRTVVIGKKKTMKVGRSPTQAVSSNRAHNVNSEAARAKTYLANQELQNEAGLLTPPAEL